MEIGYTKDIALAEEIARKAGARELWIRSCPESCTLNLNREDKKQWQSKGWSFDGAVAKKILGINADGENPPPLLTDTDNLNRKDKRSLSSSSGDGDGDGDTKDPYQDWQHVRTQQDRYQSRYDGPVNDDHVYNSDPSPDEYANHPHPSDTASNTKDHRGSSSYPPFSSFSRPTSSTNDNKDNRVPSLKRKSMDDTDPTSPATTDQHALGDEHMTTDTACEWEAGRLTADMLVPGGGREKGQEGTDELGGAEEGSGGGKGKES